MGFMKGHGALRRTTKYLSEGNIIFRKSVKVVALQCNPPKHFPHHEGLHNFVFWHVPQLKYKNPDVHIVTFRELTPTAWIKAYLGNGSEIVIDCDSRSRGEIYEHVNKILGLPEFIKSLPKAIPRKGTISANINPANFGSECERECICEMEGQIPCSRFQMLPKEMRGKYKFKPVESE